jgi:uncharacterized membrane protein
MSEAERWGSVAAGAALTVYGFTRFRRRGWILSIFGILLVRRGATGHCVTYDMLGINTRTQGRSRS